MKIALCFCGQARSFEKGFEYYKRNLLDHYDVDVYIHGWKMPNGEKALVQLYNPKDYLLEDKLVGNYDSIYTNTPNSQKWPPRFTYSALYSMAQANTLIDGEYDWVIKSRTDYALNTKIPFEELDNTKLYIPNCRMVPERDFGNDQFAFSSQENMNKYMTAWDHVDEYYDSGVQFIGEDIMQANLRKHGLVGDKLVYVNMNNPFPPGPHNGTWHSLIRDDYEQWTQTNKSI
jgi:hypothetical protein